MYFFRGLTSNQIICFAHNIIIDTINIGTVHIWFLNLSGEYYVVLASILLIDFACRLAALWNVIIWWMWWRSAWNEGLIGIIKTNPQTVKPYWDVLLKSWNTKTFKYYNLCSIIIVTGQVVNILRLRENGHYFADNIFKWIFLNENVWISIKISLKYVLNGPIEDNPIMV